MDKNDFILYMNKLEQKVIGPGLEEGLWGTEVWLPIRNGKLHSLPFSQLLGTRWHYAQPAVIDYYGLHKRSTGFMAKAVRLGCFLKGFEAPLVAFSSIRDYGIKELAPELLHDFPDFKRAVVRARFGTDTAPNQEQRESVPDQQ